MENKNQLSFRLDNLKVRGSIGYGSNTVTVMQGYYKQNIANLWGTGFNHQRLGIRGRFAAIVYQKYSLWKKQKSQNSHHKDYLWWSKYFSKRFFWYPGIWYAGTGNQVTVRNRPLRTVFYRLYLPLHGTDTGRTHCYKDLSVSINWLMLTAPLGRLSPSRNTM